jgi:hypothetical protein
MTLSMHATQRFRWCEKVLEEWSSLSTLSDTPSSMVCGEALLGAFPSDVPEDLVADIEGEEVR